jgi:hypothetical protein
LISDNPAADVYFNYTHASKFGFQLFKAVDLIDRESYNNFALALVFKHISVNPNITVTPYFGVVLEEIHSVADHGSDFSSMLISSIKINPHLSLEHTALFPNLMLERDYADWVNRVKLIYSNGHIDLTGWAWHNNKVFDEAKYTSAGLSAYYSRIKITNRMSLSAGVTGLMVANSSDTTECPKKNGVLLTIAATWH